METKYWLHVLGWTHLEKLKDWGMINKATNCFILLRQLTSKPRTSKKIEHHDRTLSNGNVHCNNFIPIFLWR